MTFEHAHKFWTQENWCDEHNDGGVDIGLEFAYPTTLLGLEFEPADGQLVDPADLTVFYWHLGWTPRSESNAKPGWEGAEDSWHGVWQSARIAVSSVGRSCRVLFEPLDSRELPDCGSEAVEYRRTIKLKVRFAGTPKLRIEGLRPVFPGALEPLDLRLEWGVVNKGALRALSVECFNAYVHDGAARVTDFPVTGANSLNLNLKCAVPDSSIPFADGNIPCVTFSWENRGFTINLLDVRAGESIWLPDFDFLVRRFDMADEPAFEHITRLVDKGMSIVDRVETLPAQTLERARIEIPRLDPAAHPRYVVLGTEANRGEFAVRYDGSIFLEKDAMKLHSFDTARLDWPGNILSLEVGIGENGPEIIPVEGYHQSVADGWKPIVATEWRQNSIEHSSECFATLAHLSLGDSETKSGMESAYLMCRWTIRNQGGMPVSVRPWILLRCGEIFHYEDGDLLGVAKSINTPSGKIPTSYYTATKNRLRILTGSSQWTIQPCRAGNTGLELHQGLTRTVELAPGESENISFCMRFSANMDDASVQPSDYDLERLRVWDFWESDMLSFGRIEGVDPHWDALAKAVKPHVLITVDKDPRSKLWHTGAATWGYWDFPNETCVQARWLDMIGDHERAAKILEPLLVGQGKAVPTGQFKSAAGAFFLSEDYNAYAYNVDLGWIHWALAEHYLFSRDKEWLHKHADRLAAACDFVARERKQTMRYDSKDQRVPEYGLLPAGGIEDVQEWRYWFEVNILCWAGISHTALALEDIDDCRVPDMHQLAREYKHDIDESIRRATISSCVVKIRDNTWLPHVPSHTGGRFADSGWIRECLESPIAKAVTVGFWEAESELVEWTLKDTEDNRHFLDPEDFGQDIAQWFSHGGFSKQPMLIDLPITYLKRGQKKHALRSLINAYAATAYEDVHCLAEWVSKLGVGDGPLYKTPDECAFLSWLRCFFVMESPGGLHLCAGVPYEWIGDGLKIQKMATYFGPISMDLLLDGRNFDARLDLDSRMIGVQIILDVPSEIFSPTEELEHGADGFDIQQVGPSKLLIVARRKKIHIRIPCLTAKTAHYTI